MSSVMSRERGTCMLIWLGHGDGGPSGSTDISMGFGFAVHSPSLDLREDRHRASRRKRQEELNGVRCPFASDADSWESAN